MILQLKKNWIYFLYLKFYYNHDNTTEQGLIGKESVLMITKKNEWHVKVNGLKVSSLFRDVNILFGPSELFCHIQEM